MSTSKVDLYMSKNMTELNALVDKSPTPKNTSSRLLVKSAGKVFDAGEQALKSGDEERAYVLFMRYFNLRKAVKSCSDYKKNEGYINGMLTNKEAMYAIEEAEKLQKSLKNRYEYREAKELRERMDQMQENSKKAQEQREKEEKEKEREKQEEKDKEEKVPVQKAPAKPGSISVEQLYTLLQDDSSLIIMDIRPADQFQASHINHRSVINMPADIIPPGCMVKDIEKNLPENSVDLWSQRGSVDQIALLDWQGSASDASLGTPLRALKDAMFKWDQNTVIRSEPLVLDGGYENWLLYYPTLTTNANVPRPPSYEQMTKKDDSLNFEYPDFDELFGAKPQPKPTESSTNGVISSQDIPNNVARQNGQPNFDRTKKPSVKTVNNDIHAVSDSENAPEAKPNGGSLFEKLREQLQDVSGKSSVTQYKPTNIELDENRKLNISQNAPATEKPSTPGVPSRSLKPKQEVSSTKDTVPETSTDSVDVMAQNAKELERIISEHKARVSQLKTDEEKLEKLQELKHKEEKDVADLMRLKRTINDELKSLEEEKQSLASMKGDSEEKKKLQVDVEKLRLERKLREEKEERLRLKRELEERDAQDARNRLEKEREQNIRLAALEVERKLNEEAKKKADQETERLRQEEDRKRKQQADVEEKARVERELEEQRQLKEEADDKARHEQQEQKRLDEERRKLEAEEREKVRMAEEAKEKERLAEEAKEKARLAEEAKEKARQAAETKERERLAAVAQAKEKARKETMEREAAEKARLEAEAREKARLEAEAREKARLEAEAREKARLEAEAREKVRVEAEAREKAKKEEEKRACVSLEQLPSGWQKKYDEKTGRYFYIDHNTGTTHWTMPAQVTKVTPAPPGISFTAESRAVPSTARELRSYKTKLKDESNVPRSSGLKRSNSTPNIAKLIDEEKENRMPKVNRAVKPSERRTQPAEPHTRPVFAEPTAAKLRVLNPVYGGLGHGLTGLRNMGNTCYLNSVVQCLSNTAAIAFYFTTGDYKRDINRENFLGHKGEIADEFGYLLYILWSGQYHSVTPGSLKYVVAKYNDRFATSEQQDSQEFLMFLLDGLHEDLNKVKIRQRLPEIDTDKLGMQKAAELSWEHHKLLNQSVIVEMFQGQLRSVVRCLHCDKRSVKFDTFMYLTLPLPSGKNRCTLQDSLNLFMKGEKMSGSSKWHCPSCKVPREAEKVLHIWKLPPTLLIHLKRFHYRGMWRDKLSTSVDFPLTDLDMRSFVVGPKKPKNFYNLYALSLHKGQSMEHGHYTAICRNPKNNKWYNFDDSDVYSTSISDIKNSQSQAYLLFYSELSNVLKYGT